MGVPKFFRYMSERYCCLNELVTEYQIPEFDNLYFDMNGIIHNCSHPSDDPHFRITEEQIFENIFNYLQYLIMIIKPKNLIFFAVDGVAPRAKMNQQRGRRFRSAKEADTAEANARKKGEVLPLEKRFDSNCITPGTVFMEKLHRQLRYFITKMQATDKLWQKPRVILSGHETPGEGEHKIMDYIRFIKSKPDYNPHTRHCLYGLDADLIMLGLCTHEPHFALLREEVQFSKKAQKHSACASETRFYLLHLSLMRDYLDLEFCDLKDKLPFPYDLECIINDWVLMCFLVGNDFIPNLPGLHITSGALNQMYQAYMDVLPTLTGYINDYGKLNLINFEIFMKRLAEYDLKNFETEHTDLQFLESRVTADGPRSSTLQVFEYDEAAGSSTDAAIDGDLAALINRTEEDYGLDDSDDLFNPAAEVPAQSVELPNQSAELPSQPANNTSSAARTAEEKRKLLRLEFEQHKRDYYTNKLKYPAFTVDVLREQAICYARAIQWNLHYYYHGCTSWSWYYPHHYAPFISDIHNFSDIEIMFKMGKPFLPFEQLLAVLPAASKDLLPTPYHILMTSQHSPIVQYYPTDFQTDLNGKKQEWEAVVLIPFIDEVLLLRVMGHFNGELTVEERLRNTHGPMLQFDYVKMGVGKVKPTEFFDYTPTNHSLLTPIDRSEILLPKKNILQGLCPKFDSQLYVPGFYTLRHLPHTGEMRAYKVKVFERASQNESMIISLLPHDEAMIGLYEAADKLIGKTVYVNYPHLQEARVVSICDSKRIVYMDEITGLNKTDDFPRSDRNRFTYAVDKAKERYNQKLGIDIGETKIVVFVQAMSGRKYIITPGGQITLEKQWAYEKSGYPLQVVISQLRTRVPEFSQFNTISEIFTKNSTCFLLQLPNYGSKCKIVSTENMQGCNVLANIYEPDFPPLEEVRRSIKANGDLYISSNTAADLLNVTATYFSSLTGSIFISTSRYDESKKVNIGLNLKYTARNEEVPGYTKKMCGVWMYSMQTVEMVKDYAKLYPKLFSEMSRKFSYYNNNKTNMFQDQLFPPETEGGPHSMASLLEWLKSLPSTKIERQKCGSDSMELTQVHMLEKALKGWQAPPPRYCAMQLDTRFLYKPGTLLGSLLPDANTYYKLCDRVVCVRENFAVPLGMQGTVVGIQNMDEVIDVMFDMPFSGAMLLQGSAPARCYRLSRSVLINISFGRRTVEENDEDENDIPEIPRNEYPKSAFVTCGNTYANTAAMQREIDSEGEEVIDLLEPEVSNDPPEPDPQTQLARYYSQKIQTLKEAEMDLKHELKTVQNDPFSMKTKELLMKHQQRLNELIASNENRRYIWQALKNEHEVHASPLIHKVFDVERIFRLAIEAPTQPRKIEQRETQDLTVAMHQMTLEEPTNTPNQNGVTQTSNVLRRILGVAEEPSGFPDPPTPPPTPLSIHPSLLGAPSSVQLFFQAPAAQAVEQKIDDPVTNADDPDIELPHDAAPVAMAAHGGGSVSEPMTEATSEVLPVENIVDTDPPPASARAYFSSLLRRQDLGYPRFKISKTSDGAWEAEVNVPDVRWVAAKDANQNSAMEKACVEAIPVFFGRKKSVSVPPSQLPPPPAQWVLAPKAEYVKPPAFQSVLPNGRPNAQAGVFHQHRLPSAFPHRPPPPFGQSASAFQPGVGQVSAFHHFSAPMMKPPAFQNHQSAFQQLPPHPSAFHHINMAPQRAFQQCPPPMAFHQPPPMMVQHVQQQPSTPTRNNILLPKKLEFDALAPRIDAPAPRIDAPAPRIDAPAPRIYAPAPRIDAPAPRIYAPAPRIDAPAPRIDAPAPRIDAPSPRINAPAPRIDVPPAFVPYAVMQRRSKEKSPQDERKRAVAPVQQPPVVELPKPVVAPVLPVPQPLHQEDPAVENFPPQPIPPMRKSRLAIKFNMQME